MLSLDAIADRYTPRRPGGPDAVALPLRHWILGAIEPNACYWLKHPIRVFRNGALAFTPVLTVGMELRTHRVERVPADLSIPIEPLEHVDTERFIASTDRDPSGRGRVALEAVDLIDFAHQRIGRHLARSQRSDRNDFAAAVALLALWYR